VISRVTSSQVFHKLSIGETMQLGEHAQFEEGSH
jgi:hypothetical protein